MKFSLNRSIKTVILCHLLSKISLYNKGFCGTVVCQFTWRQSAHFLSDFIINTFRLPICSCLSYLYNFYMRSYKQGLGGAANNISMKQTKEEKHRQSCRKLQAIPPLGTVAVSMEILMLSLIYSQVETSFILTHFLM